MINKQISFPEKETYLLLNGAAGAIETLVSPNKSNNKVTVIICHPHPLHEGTMNNKVVYTTHKAMQDLGYNTIRFNFRGVGRSEGTHSHSQGETDDLLTIADWLLTHRSEDKIILAGFSFGAFIALKASKKVSNITSLISIAPAVHHQDYISELPAPCPWLVIMGTEDEIVPPNLVFDFINNITQNKPKLEKLEGAGHFFHGQLPDLKNIIKSYFNN